MSVLNTPPVIATESVPQPVQVQQVVAPQPVQVQQVVEPQPSEPVVAPQPAFTAPEVPFTPQNVINGTYNTGSLTGTIAPEAIVNMQPVQLNQPVIQPAPAAAEVVAPTEVAPVQQAVPAPSQSEINLTDIGDLDAIINSLPQ